MSSPAPSQLQIAAIPLTEINGEPRTFDIDLANRLGFERPRKIRDLIKAHMAELEAFGVCPAVGQTPGPQGGRPGTEYFLNEEQALLIATVSDAPHASVVRAELIRVYTAWRRGQLAPPNLAEVVRDAVREALTPAAVEAALTNDPRRAAIDAMSILQVLNEAKVPAKGRRSLLRRFSRELERRVMDVTSCGEATPHRRCAHTRTWLYAPDFMGRFIRDKGRGWIADHLAKLKGQGVLQLPDPPPKQTPDGTKH